MSTHRTLIGAHPRWTWRRGLGRGPLAVQLDGDGLEAAAARVQLEDAAHHGSLVLLDAPDDVGAPATGVIHHLVAVAEQGAARRRAALGLPLERVADPGAGLVAFVPPRIPGRS